MGGRRRGAGSWSASPPSSRLFARDPFHGGKPAAVRAVLWQYWFTDREERARTGAWWRREYQGLYAPEVRRETTGESVVGEPP